MIPAIAAGIGQLGAIQAVAPSLGVELRPVAVRDADEIERAVAAFAQSSEWRPDRADRRAVLVHRGLIIALAARHRLPAVYPFRYYVADGGLISYGPDTIDPYRRAAGYVDRILKGEKPCRPAGTGPGEIRAGGQPQDRQSARPRVAGVSAVRGDKDFLFSVLYFNVSVCPSTAETVCSTLALVVVLCG